jgi:hypothetical protein
MYIYNWTYPSRAEGYILWTLILYRVMLFKKYLKVDSYFKITPHIHYRDYSDNKLSPQKIYLGDIKPYLSLKHEIHIITTAI